MPCLNEAETLASCINKAKVWLSNSSVKGEILIADNGSHDGSQGIAKKLGVKVISVHEKGYGSALYYGTIAARGEWVIMGDSDNSYDFSRLDHFVIALQKGADLVIGNRFEGGIDKGAMPWKNRFIGNPLLTFIGRHLFKCPSHDFHCGLRAVNKKSFIKMDIRSKGMEFASEMIIKASLFGMRIVEVPTTLSKDGRNRPPHLRPFRDGWRHLRFMLLYSPRWLFLYPGIFISTISGIGYITLLNRSIKFGSAVLSFNSLFILETGILIGVLFIFFAVVVRVLAFKDGLLPSNKWLEKIKNSPVLEVGGIAGILIFLSGLAITFKVFLKWSEVNFSSLPNMDLLSLVSLSTFAMITGALVFIFSLVVGFLFLPTR